MPHANEIVNPRTVLQFPAATEQQARWEVSAPRFRMLTGIWQFDANQRMSEFYDPAASQFFPPTEIGLNAYLSFVIQQSTLYDDAFTASAEGVSDEDMEKLFTPQLLSYEQEALTLCIGMQESLIRVDFDVKDDGADGTGEEVRGKDAGEGLRYRVVAADTVEGWSSTKNPGTPNKIIEYRTRKIKVGDRVGEEEWTRETWDITDMGAPVFKIEALGREESSLLGEQTKDGWSDVTQDYAGNDGVYPYVTKDGAPIMPYVVKHFHLRDRLWSPNFACEVVSGTLSVACLVTDWMAGFRDGSAPLRCTVNLELSGHGTSQENPGKASPFIVAPRNTIIPFKSKQGMPGSFHTFAPTIDPAKSWEAIAAFAAQLAVYFGLQPADVHRSATAVSGYALTIKAEGLRRARKRIIPAMRLSDQQLLWTAGLMLNSYDNGSYPEEVSAYAIKYPEVGKSPQEVEADIKVADAKRAAGLIGRVGHYLLLNPGMDRETAKANIIRDAQEDADLAAAISLIPSIETEPNGEE